MHRLIRELFINNGCQEILSYIDNTKIPENIRYDLQGKDYYKLSQLSSHFDALYITYLFGMAKGYRMAKAEVKTN